MQPTKKISISFFALLLSFSWLTAQENTNPVSISGYAETYYSFDFNEPDNNTRPYFIYSHNRHNEFNLNLGYLKASLNQENVRANLALMAGTYANANLASEPGVLRNVFEANAGVKLSKKANLWLDAGILPSHIGFESAVGKDCWALTRGLIAETSPYFESGARLSVSSDDDKWYAGLLLLNGWQRIQRPDGNSTPAFGHQITYKPNDKITLNSSSFIGSDKPDVSRQMRYFHNFYGIFQVSEQVGLTLGFDVGAEQKAKGSSDYNVWYNPVALLRFTPGERLSVCVRGEYYNDPDGVIVSTGTPNGFQIFGYSCNLDYKFSDQVLWRIEGRGFSSKDELFVRDGRAQTSNFAFTTALAVSF
ncbi:MAG: porin [Saprospiraceae bacterium]|nr:porin [Saprospiraceae bacterium]